MTSPASPPVTAAERAQPVRRHALRRPATWPWWAQVLAVHGAARLVSAVVLLVVARSQVANPWTPAAPGYLEFTGLMWDAGWYRQIAEQGYPDGLPRGADGAVQQNAWAFFPLFPALVRGVMTLTGGPWHVVAPVLATAAGAAAALVLHRLVAVTWRGPSPHAVGLVTVALLGTSAASPVLQIAYTESLALLLVAAALLALARRRYAVVVPLVLALGLTRAVALPVALAVLLHGLARWRADRTGDEPFPAPQRVAVAALAALGVTSGLLWPAVTAWATGETDAYTETQAAWRGTGAVVPVVPWFEVGRWLLGDVGPVVVVVLLGLLALLVLCRPVRRLGPELHGWVAGYVTYLVLVLEPGTSLVRFALLAFPVWVALAGWLVRGRHRVTTAVLVLVGVGGQCAWVWLLWRLVPPSGWPP